MGQGPRRAWTVEKAKDELDECVELKLAPILQSLDTFREQIGSRKDRDKEQDGKLDDLSKSFADLDKRLLTLEMTVRHSKDDE